MVKKSKEFAVSMHRKPMQIWKATHKKEIFQNLEFFFLSDMEKQELQTEFASEDLVRK